MLTEIYIEALLVDEKLADRVWEAWDVGEIDDLAACVAWRTVHKDRLAKALTTEITTATIETQIAIHARRFAS